MGISASWHGRAFVHEISGWTADDLHEQFVRGHLRAFDVHRGLVPEAHEDQRAEFAVDGVFEVTVLNLLGLEVIGDRDLFRVLMVDQRDNASGLGEQESSYPL